MKLITKNTDYAIRALLVLGMAPEMFLSAREIAEKEMIPLPFLRRILRELLKKGYMESREGTGGGVRLTRRTEDIRISEVIQFFQGRIQLSTCMFRKTACRNRTFCPLRKRIMAIEELVSREFNAITLATLLHDRVST